jgi:hypothetical protein
MEFVCRVIGACALGVWRTDSVSKAQPYKRCLQLRDVAQMPYCGATTREKEHARRY